MKSKHLMCALILALTAVAVCTAALAEDFRLPVGLSDIGGRSFRAPDDALIQEPDIFVTTPGSSSSSRSSSSGWQPQNPQTVSVGENQITLNPGEHMLFSFTAPADAEYSFYFTGTSDASCFIYDTELREIGRGYNPGFCLSGSLPKDMQIFIEVYLYDASERGSISLCVDQDGHTETSSSKYRALIIGNVYDNNPDISTLEGCDGDRAMMAHMLSQLMTRTPYAVTEMRNLTAGQMLDAIPVAFEGADSNSISLFYYSGHGFSGSGHLVGADGSELSYATLKKALDAVPGKKIVILDCCYSGNAIGKDAQTRELSAKDLDDINSSIICTFAPTIDMSGELAANDYYVLTASSKDQPSWGSRYFGFFTYCMVYGSGWDAYESEMLDGLYSDVNGDGCVSLQEAYVWTEDLMDEFRNEDVQQRTQVYPTDEDLVLWAR